MWPAIFNMSMLATGRMVLSFASGLMMQPVERPFFLIYTQMLFVTSVRGITFLPQIAANASLSFFGAKMPLPAFFIANAFFLPFAFLAIMPIVFFSALVLRNSALVIVVLVVATVVFATVVLATVVLVVICE